MISKAKLKYVKSLQLKKYRKQEQCFVVEGAKSVLELLRSDYKVEWLAGTPDFLDTLTKFALKREVEREEATEAQLMQVGTFQTNDAAIAIAQMKSNQPPKLREDEFALVLDDIRDPGNLGTIIRTADWYGITHVIASEETTDFYNPKTISATMGSFCRVSMYYTDLVTYLSGNPLPTYGAFLNGENVHELTFSKGGLLVMGNESNGISAEIERLIKTRVTIPRIGGAESLNAAIATGIMLDNIFRSKK